MWCLRGGGEEGSEGEAAGEAAGEVVGEACSAPGRAPGRAPDQVRVTISISQPHFCSLTSYFQGSSFGSGSKSNYPKQQWSSGGSSGGIKSRTPIGGGGFVNPKTTSYGSSFGGSKTSSFKSPGYGTNFGTSFKGGVGKYGGKGFSKKALGLGVGAGFLGGAALGAAGTVATMGVRSRV